MRRQRMAACLLAAILVALFVPPAAALASGDQVNRPDGAGYFDGGQHAGGELPDWAPRQQGGAQP